MRAGGSGTNAHIDLRPMDLAHTVSRLNPTLHLGPAYSRNLFAFFGGSTIPKNILLLYQLFHLYSPQECTQGGAYVCWLHLSHCIIDLAACLSTGSTLPTTYRITTYVCSLQVMTLSCMQGRLIAGADTTNRRLLKQSNSVVSLVGCVEGVCIARDP